MRRLPIAIAIVLASLVRADDDPALRSFYTANGLFNRGMYELAATEYRDFLNARPAHEHAPVAHYGLGVSLARLGQWENARAELQAALADPAMPHRAEAGLLLAQADMRAGDFTAASSTLASVIKSDSPAAADAAALLIESLHRGARHQEACAAGADLAQRWPDSPLRPRGELFWGLSLVALDRDRDACEHLRAAANALPDDAGLALAAALTRLGDLDAARREYQGVIDRKSPAHADPARLGLARALLDADQPRKALDALGGINPEGPVADDARLTAARALLALDQPAEAARAVEALAGSGTPAAIDAGYLLAKARAAANQPAHAVEAIRAAIAVAPADHPRLADLRYDLAASLLAAGDLPNAEKAFESFVRDHPAHAMAAEAWRILAWNAHRAGDLDACRERIRAALALDPSGPTRADLESLAAENDLADGDANGAARAFAALAERDSDRAAHHLTRQGLALASAGKPAEAARALEAAAARGSTEAEYELGALHFDRNDWAAAEPWLARYAARSDAPRVDAARLRLGLARRALGSIQPAIDVLASLDAAPDPDIARRARFELGQTYASVGDDARARTLLTRVAQDPAATDLAGLARLQLGALESRASRHDDAARWFDLAAGDPSLAGPAARGKARALLAADRPAEALEALAGADEDESRAWRAIALSRAGRTDDALAAIHALAGAALEPATRDAADAELAWLLARGDHPDEARAVHERLAANAASPAARARAVLALADLDLADDPARAAQRLAPLLSDSGLDPDTRAEATYRAAAAARALARPAEAASLLESFESQHPGHRLIAPALALRGEALLDASRPADASSVLDEFLSRFPDDPAAPVATLKSAEAAAALGAWARAERAYARYLDLWPQGELWFNARFGLGFARENQARHAEAIADYRAVIDSHAGPTAARAQFQLGECLYAQGKLDEAVRELLRVDILHAYPEWSAASLYEAGRCLNDMDQPAEARRQWQAVVDRFPDTRWAELARQSLDAPARTPPGKK